MELETLAFIASGVGILSPIVGWGILLNREGKSRGKIDADVAGNIKTMGEDISSIKITLGNGGFTGLKGEIHSMQVNCAKDMSALKTEVTNLKEKKYIIVTDQEGKSDG